ncbi:serine/threonine-protein kinase [Nocardioides sp. KR10-350]|uniref:serine/threonine-protein kinase n=1 Tax=Nocardioides cheoyonin TaxID=3156615 RepID=UPI0032B3E30E
MTTAPRRKAEGTRTVGDYTLLAPLGEGGMGVVHLARNERTGERVALKILRPQIVGDEEGRARLAREVSSLGRVRSRWIAEIVDADPWGPVPYVATRYVPGLSLHDEVLEEGPIAGPDLMWFARGLAEGIAACHEAGVLHRDVKPSNVIMEGRTPVLIDFGLARVADDPKITHTGWLLGTPGYLPPEILHGDDATPATDVHSWAATVAYAATGRPPFGKGPSMAIMDRARRGQFDLAGAPDELRPVLAAALSPDPGRRPTLEVLLAWLRDPSAPSPVAVPSYAGRGGPAREDPQPTLPYSVARGSDTEPETEPERTLVDSWDAAPAKPGFAMLTRRFLLWLAAGLAAGAGLAAYPWVTLVALLALVWVLRSASLASSHVARRREVRGAKWYDGPRLVLGAPWDLVRSVPSTVLLQLWAIGIAIAAVLVCYAVAAPLASTLYVGGVVLAAMLWLGPGGERVRGPLAGVVHPLARGLRRWAVAFCLVIAVGAALLWSLSINGVDWFPGTDEPKVASIFH